MNVVSDYKDTNFWKQFTTGFDFVLSSSSLFQTTKIQTFESNSQPGSVEQYPSLRCFRLQRYKLLKAIHNPKRLVKNFKWVVSDYKDTNFWKQFTTQKPIETKYCCCFRLQRYKLLKAIHNYTNFFLFKCFVVSDYKDTNFWKQFTTTPQVCFLEKMLFQTTKIQTFESNSQRQEQCYKLLVCCFRLQRYKLLKAIHNQKKYFASFFSVVSDYKDTNFWKQFTTRIHAPTCSGLLFQTTKIQTFESNSQLRR